MLPNLIKDMKRLSDPEKAKNCAWFFKTDKGEYGEGDKFIGLTVPQIRAIAKKYKDLDIKEVQELLKSEVHEHRMCALIILVERFKKYDKKSDEKGKEEIYHFYLKHTKYINNWDLVDVTCPTILGGYLLNKGNKEREILYKLAKSKSLWEQRISIVATHYFIRNNDFKDTIAISEMLVKHKHDLIHKAVGWMLREVGNRDAAAEEKFLKKHHRTMPRTMLRYAIEKFDEKKRKFYMGK